MKGFSVNLAQLFILGNRVVFLYGCHFDDNE